MIPRYLEAKPSTYRSKAGPNGHALVSAYIDACSLTRDQAIDLVTLGGKSLEKTLFLTSHPRMWAFMAEHFKPLATLVRKIENGINLSVTRRLSYFADKEDKVRVIGILDWYSQLALEPLHNFLMKVLAKIPQDCTLDQGKFVNLLKDKDIYYSIDLSNATDRFPIKVIASLLKSKFPQNYVEA